MGNPICEKCKPTQRPQEEVQSAVTNTGCGHLYPAVEECMKKYKGNITSCRIEWEEFQQCMKEVKAQKTAKSISTSGQ